MYKLTDIRDIHLELTSKCQARCPMCPRRINGGPMNPLFDPTEIDIATFKKWFSIDFIKQLDSLFMCGNLGDPIIAQDCIEIYSYLRESNSNIRLSMHTNGSARSTRFWQQLAELNVRVTFGIDGLADTHSLYRISTDYNKIIENANTFIQHGGVAEWHMLVFEHNQHQVEECRAVANQMGFGNFQIKHTSRFSEDKWHVLDDEGKTTHIIRPTDISKRMISRIQESQTIPSEINCKSKKHKQVYIAADGTISPCCWLDLKWNLPKQKTRIDYMDMIGEFHNLNNNTMSDIFEGGYFEKIEATWDHQPLQECSRQCGKFDRLGEQFV